MGAYAYFLIPQSRNIAKPSRNYARPIQKAVEIDSAADQETGVGDAHWSGRGHTKMTRGILPDAWFARGTAVRPYWMVGWAGYVAPDQAGYYAARLGRSAQSLERATLCNLSGGPIAGRNWAREHGDASLVDNITQTEGGGARPV